MSRPTRVSMIGLAGILLTFGLAHTQADEVYVWDGFQPIPDQNPAGTVAEIVVPGDQGPILIDDLDVDAIIEHGWQGDIVIELIHVDSGTSAVLMNRPGDPEIPLGFSVPNIGNPFKFVDFLFDDEAPTPYDFASVKLPGLENVSGVWQSDTDALSGFDGLDAVGLWQLRVVDAGPGGIGQIRRFSLHITEPCQPPAFIQPLESQTLCVGDTLIIDAQVSGAGPFAYDWCFEDICGFIPSIPILQIDDIALNQGGTYSVEVFGACGSVWSGAIQIDVTQRCQTEPPQCPTAAPNSSCACMGDEEGIYLFSGEFQSTVVDLKIPGRGMDFAWTRKYRSRVDIGFNRFANQWDFSYDIHIQRQGSSFLIWDGNTRKDHFPLQPDGTWTSDEFFRVLEQNQECSRPENNNCYALTFEDTSQWRFFGFDSFFVFQLESVVDRNGNTMLFDYHENFGTLNKVTDTLGREINIAYNGDGKIASVTDFAGRSVTYEYYQDGDAGGSFGDLKSVTTPAVLNTAEFPIPPGHDYPDGKTTVYTYSKNFADERLNHNLLTITDPKGQTYLTNEYAPTEDSGDLEHDRIVRQTWGDPGDIIDVVYVAQTPEAGNNQAVVKAIVNDRVGNVTEQFYDVLNRLVINREYTGRWDPDLPTLDGDLTNPLFPKLRTGDPDFFETRYEWNVDSLATRIVFPNLNEAVSVYDSDNDSQRSQGNMLQRCLLRGPLAGDQEMICEQFEYDDDFGGCCGTNFATRHVDGLGNETLHTYDDFGNRTHTTHRIPSIVEDFVYNGFGQTTKHTLPDNGSGSRREDVYTYYDSGPQLGYLHEEIIDQPGFGLTTTYEYDVVGNLTRVIDPRGHDTLYAVNQLNQVLRETSREVIDGGGVRYQSESFYDPNDYVIRIEIPNIDDSGIEVPENPTFTTTYEYDILNYLTRRTQEVDPDHDIVTEYTYDDNRNSTLVRFGEATNGNQPTNIVRTLYDERDLTFLAIRAESDADQSTTQYDYDGNRNQTRTSQGLEDVGGERITVHAYDGYDRLFTSTDPMANVTQYHYDPNYNMVSLRIDGELSDVEGGAGNLRLNETTYEYDAMDRRTRQVTEFFDAATQDPIMGGQQLGQAITEMEYSANSQVTREINDNLHDTTFVYDTANRKFTVTDAKANSMTYTYDPNSNLISVVEVEKSDLLNPDEEFTTTYVYDNLDRRIRIIDNVGNTDEYAYDSRNNRTFEDDALGHETRYEYDGMNRLTRTVRDLDDDGADGDGADITTTQTWDDTSRLTEQTDDNGNTTSYVYDALDRLVFKLYADETDYLYNYDVHHNVIEMLDANESFVDFQYDLLNRTVDKFILPGKGVADDLTNGTTFEAYFYDGLSRLVAAVDDDSLFFRAYDSRSNLTVEFFNEKQFITSVYDGVGNQLSCVYPGGRTVGCTYDELERKKTVSDTGGLIASYDYVGPSRVERREYGNGTRADFVYDGITGIPNPANDFGVKQIIAITHSRVADGSVIDDRTFTWDPLYNKLERIDIRDNGPELTTEYVYDSIYRLTRTTVTDDGEGIVRDTQYDLDGVGNRAEVIGEPDPGLYVMDPTLPQPADFQMNQYTLTPSEPRGYDQNGNLIDRSGRVTVTYDYRNQMVAYDDGPLYHYMYDALGRRIARVVDANEGDGVVTQYFYDGWQVVEEQNNTKNPGATYVYGIYIDEVLNMQRGGTDYFYHTDDLYNVMALTLGSPTAGLWEDDLDSYAPGPLVGVGGWEAWDNDAGAANFEVTSAQSLSEPHSVAIDAPDDAVRLYSGFDTGISIFSAWQYIPSEFDSGGAGADDGTYFVLLNTYNPGGPYDRSVQMQFDSNDGLCKVWQGDGSNTIAVPYDTDRWVKIQVYIDLDNDWTQVYYDDELITEYTWTGGILGEGGGALHIGAVDLDGNNSSVVYYDDLRLERFEEGLPGAVVERYEYADYGAPTISHCPADQDGTGTIEAFDLALLLGGWGPNPGHPADFNNDGVVDAFDLAQLLGKWGLCVEPQPIGNPYLFNGRRYDPETGWYYYRTRYLDPAAGRFTTRDTIGIWGDAGNLGNGYTYVGNNPLTALDPYGLQEGLPGDLLEDVGARLQAEWEVLPDWAKQPSMCAGFKRKTGWAHIAAMMFDPQYVFCFRRSFGGTATPSLPDWPVNLRPKRTKPTPSPAPPRPSGPSHFSGAAGACMTRCLAAKGVDPGDSGPKGFINALVAACRKECSKPKGPTGPTAPTPPPPPPPGRPSHFSGSCMARCLAANGVRPGNSASNALLAACRKKCSNPAAPAGPAGPICPGGPISPSGGEPSSGRSLPLGHGKMAGFACVDESCQIVTRAGPRRIGDIRIGDEVLTPNGEFRRVIDKDFGRIWNERRNDYVQISTSAGSIVLTRDHIIGGRPAGEWGDGDSITLQNGEVAAVTVRPAKSEVSGDLRLDGEADYVTADGFVIGSMLSRHLASERAGGPDR